MPREYLLDFPAHAHFDVARLLIDQAVRLGHAAVPVLQKTVIYTAALDAEDRRRCKDLRADLVLLKPLTFAVLRKKLSSLLGAEGSAHALRCQPEYSAPAEYPASAGHSAIAAPRGRETKAEGDLDPQGEEALALWNRQAAMDALDDDLQLMTRLAGVLRGDLRIRDAELEAALAAN